MSKKSFYDYMGPVYGISKTVEFENDIGEVSMHEVHKFWRLYENMNNTRKFDFVNYLMKSHNNFKNGLSNPQLAFSSGDNSRNSPKISLGKMSSYG